MKKVLFAAALCLFSLQADAYMCANTYQYIDIGDTMDKVIASCGKPISQKKERQQMQSDKAVRQLFFKVATAASDQNSPDIVVTIENGKVKGISVGGTKMTSSNACNETAPIRVGDDESYAIENCGQPYLINDGSVAEDKGVKDVITLIYQFNPNTPAVTMQFIDGKLTAIQ